MDVEKMRAAEQGIIDKNEKHIQNNSGRYVKDFSGCHWQMERMRPGQGKAEGIHLLLNELSGNNFSWNFAKVPGDVYTDLYRAGELDDPFMGRNMGRCKWVQDYEWWYNYSFNIPEEMRGKNLTLVFEGVDYSCEVWINGHYLGSHEGMMSSFKFDITEFVDLSQEHVPTNLLTLKLDPPPKNQKNFAGLKHNFAGDYLTGLIPFGIWKPVKLIATTDVRIENFRIETNLCDSKAIVDVDTEFTGLVDKSFDAELNVTLANGDQKFTQNKTITVSRETKNKKVTFEIENPKLWWPYDLGEQNMYDITITINRDSQKLDEYKDRVGLREVHMEMNPGFTKEEVENPWTFVINGKSMFLRSACWGGPPSIFYGRNSVEKYRFYLEKAKECNINNLRIFGWHPAEVDDFYRICDELGITVWTNFSFATQVFRDDEEYLQKVDKEIAEIVKDRRNHPCTIMWMGGEEVYFSEAHVRSNNRKLMERVGKITKKFTNVPYADASPLSSRQAIKMGYKPKESIHANSHYYAAGAVFMEDYYPNLDYCIIPELTAASSPNVSSLKKFIPKDELWPFGLSWGYHAADIHVLQNLNYEVFGDTCMDSLEHFVEATQIAQGTIFQYALEHFRRQKPHVSGVALCHFITNWPIIKWDIVDYYGEKKLSYDFVKNSYKPLLPSMEFKKRRWLPEEEFKASIWVINDYYKEYKNLSLKYTVLDPQGKEVKSETTLVNIKENSSEKFANISCKVIGKIGEKFTVKLELKDGEKLLSDNKYTLLIDDQEKAKVKAYELYKKMHEQRNKYGRGYYRYTPQLVFNDGFIGENK